MRKYTVSCCSTADLSPEWANKRNIPFVCFNYTLNGEPKKDDMGRTSNSAELFELMLKGADVKTSQIGVGEYISFFREILDRGEDLLHVSISSAISGTYNSACVARDTIKDDYPDRKIFVLDSLCASGGYGFLMDHIADRRDQGDSIEELCSWIMENRLKVQHVFYSTDLTFYIRGGRISKTTGTIGNVLGICPLLDVDEKGGLRQLEKVRTKKRVIRRAVALMAERARDGKDYAGKCFMVHSDPDLAEKTAQLIESTFPRLDGKVAVYPIGVTIGCHTGPGTVAIFFWGEERKA